MGFAAPALLPLAALAAVPLLIHILSRLRLRRIRFPSLMLLRTVRRERFSWIRLKEIVLLVLRTIALLALLLSLARPFLATALPAFGRATDVVLLVDDSYSMRYAGRWERAIVIARDLLGSLGRGRRALLLVSSGSPAPAEPAPPGRLIGRLDSIAPTSSAHPLLPALERAAGVAESLDARLVVITDLQRRAFEGDWRPGPGVVLLDVGRPGFDNACLAGLYPDNPLAASGTAVRLRADLVNFGDLLDLLGALCNP